MTLQRQSHMAGLTKLSTRIQFNMWHKHIKTKQNTATNKNYRHQSNLNFSLQYKPESFFSALFCFLIGNSVQFNPIKQTRRTNIYKMGCCVTKLQNNFVNLNIVLFFCQFKYVFPLQIPLNSDTSTSKQQNVFYHREELNKGVFRMSVK